MQKQWLAVLSMLGLAGSAARVQPQVLKGSTPPVKPHATKTTNQVKTNQSIVSPRDPATNGKLQVNQQTLRQQNQGAATGAGKYANTTGKTLTPSTRGQSGTSVVKGGNNQQVTKGNNQQVTKGNNQQVTKGNNQQVTKGNNQQVTKGNQQVTKGNNAVTKNNYTAVTKSNNNAVTKSNNNAVTKGTANNQR
jgi:hypothetical protein